MSPQPATASGGSVGDRLRPIARALSRDPAGAVFALAIGGLLAVAIVGLPMAMLGVFRPWLALPLIGVGWFALIWLTWGRGLDTLIETDRRAVSVIALCVVGGFGGFAALHSGQHILTDRDPGVYILTGEWVAEHGNLIFDTGLPESVVEASNGGPGVTQGVYPREGGTGYFQFTHLLAVLLAVASWLGGEGTLLRLPALIAAVACLGVFVLARRLAGGVPALIALVAMVLHPVTMHLAKDSNSEFLAVAFQMAGLSLWLTADSATSWVHWTLVGALVGGVTLARIDGWMTLALFLFGASYVVLWRDPGSGRLISTVGPLVAGLGFVSAIGLLDLVARSPLYLTALEDEARPLFLLAAIGVVIILAAWGHRGRWGPSAWLRTRRFLSVGVGAVVAGLGLFGLFVRPLLGDVVGAERDIGFGLIQAGEGLEVDLHRSYAEESLRWFTRYESYPFVILLLAGVVLAAVVMLRSADRVVPVLTILLGVAILYLWKPSVAPDHFWAMRRYLPVVIPLGFVLLCWTIGRASRYVRHRSAALAVVTIPLAFGLLTMAWTGAPVAAARTHVGLLDTTRRVCALLPDNAVAVMNDDLGSVFLLAVRTLCGVPTQVVDDVATLAAARAAGFVPTAIVEPERCVGGAEIARVDGDYSVPERTISRTPAGSEVQPFSVSVKLLDPAVQPSFVMPSEALAGFEVAITATAQARDSIIATLGSAEAGLRLRLARDGSAEMVMDTSEGRLGVVISFVSIADGRTRVIGGYLTHDTFYSICDGQVMAATTLPGEVTFVGEELTLRPTPGAESPLDAYQGDVTLIQVIAG